MMAEESGARQTLCRAACPYKILVWEDAPEGFEEGSLSFYPHWHEPGVLGPEELDQKD